MMPTQTKKQIFEGKFEIQGEISKGQTGTIYYGYDIELRQEVAIKIYHSHLNGRLIRGRAFVEKSKPLLLIDHPNLIKIFKVEQHEDTPIVFMEFFDAPSLQQMIRNKGPLLVHDMLILAREITEVLVHIHFQGIIHGTLHPGHVLVGPQGQIKVMDLGLSWILMDILANGDEELLRPLPYFPPEIAKGELLNVSSDLYSLGFMMYEMLTGTVPYAGLPKTSIVGKLAFDQADPTFDFPDSAPEAICELIQEMTRNKSQQRLQDATYVLTIINQQLSKLPLSKDSSFLPRAAPNTPPPIHTEPIKSSQATASTDVTASQASAPTKPAQTQSPAVQRPRKSMDYRQGQRTSISKKIGLTLGILLLLCAAGAVGYWYRDLLDPRISLPDTQTYFPEMEPRVPQTQAVKSTLSPLPNLEPTSESSTQAIDPHNPDSQLDSLNAVTTTDMDHTAGLSPTSVSKHQDLAPPPISVPSPTGGEPLTMNPESTSPQTTTTLNKEITQPPTPNEPTPAKNHDSTQNRPSLNQVPTPNNQAPSPLSPAEQEVAPFSTPKVRQRAFLQDSTNAPNKKIQRQNNEATTSSTSAEKPTHEPTDTEIEELLQQLESTTP